MGAPAASCGRPRGPQYFLAEEMLGWVSRGWSESRTRPADLTTLVPRRGKKSLRPQPQQTRKKRAPSEGLPSVFKSIGKIFVSARTPAPGRGRRQFYESTSWGKNKGCTNLAHPRSTGREVFFAKLRRWYEERKLRRKLPHRRRTIKAGLTRSGQEKSLPRRGDDKGGSGPQRSEKNPHWRGPRVWPSRFAEEPPAQGAKNLAGLKGARGSENRRA